MFLQQLNEEEKVAFLELAYIIAKANGIIDDKEHQMLVAYQKEMELEIDLETHPIRPFQEVVNIFKDKKIKRIVFLESLAVAFADGIYHEEQKEHIHELKQYFSISDDDYESFKTWINKMNSLYYEAVELLDD